jgi:hypothetical protein
MLGQEFGQPEAVLSVLSVCEFFHDEFPGSL